MTRASKSASATCSTVVSTGTGPWPFLPCTGWPSSPATVTSTSSSASRYCGYSSSMSSKSSAARMRTLRCARAMFVTIPARMPVTRAQAGPSPGPVPDLAPHRVADLVPDLAPHRVADLMPRPVPMPRAGRLPVPPRRPVPRRDGQDVPHVPAGVVVGEDRPPQVPAPGAVGAEHPGRGEDGVLRVVRGEPGGPVGPDGVFGERGRLELHRPLGALAVLALVYPAGRGPAVVRFHRADPGQHLPGEPPAGPSRRLVPGQVVRRDPGRGGRGRGQGRRAERQHEEDHGRWPQSRSR